MIGHGVKNHVGLGTALSLWSGWSLMWYVLRSRVYIRNIARKGTSCCNMTQSLMGCVRR